MTREAYAAIRQQFQRRLRVGQRYHLRYRITLNNKHVMLIRKECLADRLLPMGRCFRGQVWNQGIIYISGTDEDIAG